MRGHCPVTGEPLGRCECGACDDIGYDAAGRDDDGGDAA